MENFLSESIEAEAITALTSVFVGMMYGFVYDSIRIFRRLFVHKGVLWISIEDTVFWIAAAIHGYVTFYQGTDGDIRGYTVVGIIGGVFLYRAAFGIFYVKYVSRTLRLFVKKVLKN